MVANFSNKISMLVCVTAICVSFSFAQDTKSASHNITIESPAVALLDIEGNTEMHLTPVAPTEAGQSLDYSNSVNSSLWINVSSIVGQYSKTSRDVGVRIESGQMPAGVALKLRTANAVGGGAGNFGNVQPEITLSNNSQNIINGLGSCYTGNGVASGYNITYALEKTTYGNIRFEPSILTIAYTISD